jgi:hypothetical protein
MADVVVGTVDVVGADVLVVAVVVAGIDVLVATVVVVGGRAVVVAVLACTGGSNEVSTFSPVTFPLEITALRVDCNCEGSTAGASGSITILYSAMTLPGLNPYTSISTTDGFAFFSGSNNASSTCVASDLNCCEFVSLRSAVKATLSRSSDWKTWPYCSHTPLVFLKNPSAHGAAVVAATVVVGFAVVVVIVVVVVGSAVVVGAAVVGMAVQFLPSPLKPSLQVQLKPPIVLVQLALVSHT